MASLHSSAQPQSQAIKRADDRASRIPLAIDRLTSAMTSAGGRFPHRGHPPPDPWDQQLVRFSDPVIVKKPPSCGVALQIAVMLLLK